MDKFAELKKLSEDLKVIEVRLNALKSTDADTKEEDTVLDISYIEESYRPITDYIREPSRIIEYGNKINGFIIKFVNGKEVKCTFTPATKDFQKDLFYIVSINVDANLRNTLASTLREALEKISSGQEIIVQEMPDYREPIVRTLIKGYLMKKEDLKQLIEEVDIGHKISL